MVNTGAACKMTPKIKWCHVHLAYIGQGIFAELEMRLDMVEFEIFRAETPVRVETVETKTVVIGELNSKESETLKCLLQIGLSTEQVPLDDTVTVKQESSQAQQLANEFEFEPEPELSTSQPELSTSQVSGVVTGITTEPRHKPNIEVVTSVHLDDKSSINILKELEVKIPRLSEAEIKKAVSPKAKVKPKTKVDCKLKQSTKEDMRVMKPKRIVRQPAFKLAAHGIRERKRIYNFKCKVPHWNWHHLLKHKHISFICDVCGKSRTTLSGFRVHQYVHQAKTFVCNKCDKNFTFKSEMVAHKNLHQCSKLLVCFVSGCKQAYKWPQDLDHHICTNVAQVKKCKMCMYSTNKPCMLDKHMNVHIDIKKYKCCKGCNIHFRHRMQQYRHKSDHSVPSD